MTTDINVSQLIINKLTKEQYESITTPSDTQLYMVTDEEISYNDLTDKPTIPTVSNTYDAASTDAMSGIAVANALSNKQDSLSTAQLNAVNSGITSEKVTTYDGYSSTIANKQDTLVSGTNIKTINNNSILGEGNLDIDGLPSQTGNDGKFLTTNGTAASWAEIQAGSDIDNSTITKNASDKIQAVGIINQNTATDATNPLELWEGTEAEWNTGGAVKDTYYAWDGGLISSTSSITGDYWYGVAYSNNTFVTITSTNKQGSGYTATSINNGSTWTEGSTKLTNSRKIIYGGNKFVVSGRNTTMWYSSDGTSWTTVSNGAGGYAICYDGTKYINIAVNHGVAKSTTDFVTWNTVTTPPMNCQAIAYSDYENSGIYVAVGEQSSVPYDKTICFSGYTSISWNNLLTSGKYYDVISNNNGKFVAVGTSIFEMEFTGTSQLTYNICNNDSISAYSVTYGNGKFYAIGAVSSSFPDFTTSNTLYYKDEADIGNSNVAWSTYTLPAGIWTSITYGNGKLIIVGSSNNVIILSDEQGVFTITSTPTTKDTVYSAPEVESALTITSVDTDTITCSNNKTYSYNSVNNQYSYYTVGDSYPNLLCNIEDVGVKKGTTLIADKNTAYTSSEVQTIWESI